jgi:hypothetical protein
MRKVFTVLNRSFRGTHYGTRTGGMSQSSLLAFVALLAGCNAIQPAPPSHGLTARTSLPSITDTVSNISVDAEVDRRAGSTAGYAARLTDVWAGLQRSIAVGDGLFLHVVPSAITLQDGGGPLSESGLVSATPQLVPDNEPRGAVMLPTPAYVQTIANSGFHVGRVFSKSIAEIQSDARALVVGRRFSVPRQADYPIFADPSIVVTGLDAFSKDGSIVFNISFTGGVHGNIFLYGTPRLTPDKTRIYFPDLQFTRESIDYVNSLYGVIGATPETFLLRHDLLQDYLRAQLSFPIRGLLSEAKLSERLSGLKPSSDSSLTIILNSSTISQPVVTDSDILVSVVYNGSANLAITPPPHEYKFEVELIHSNHVRSHHNDTIYGDLRIIVNGKQQAKASYNGYCAEKGADCRDIPEGIWDGLDWKASTGTVTEGDKVVWTLNINNFGSPANNDQYEKAADAVIGIGATACATAGSPTVVVSAACLGAGIALKVFTGILLGNCDGAVVEDNGGFTEHDLDILVPAEPGKEASLFHDTGPAGDRDANTREYNNASPCGGFGGDHSDYWIRIGVLRVK